MASIVKRGKNYSVVYSYVNDLGVTKQKWQSCPTYKEAQRTKVEIEHDLMMGTFVAPVKQTVVIYNYIEKSVKILMNTISLFITPKY